MRFHDHVKTHPRLAQHIYVESRRRAAMASQILPLEYVSATRARQACGDASTTCSRPDAPPMLTLAILPCCTPVSQAH